MTQKENPFSTLLEASGMSENKKQAIRKTLQMQNDDGTYIVNTQSDYDFICFYINSLYSNAKRTEHTAVNF